MKQSCFHSLPLSVIQSWSQLLVSQRRKLTLDSWLPGCSGWWSVRLIRHSAPSGCGCPGGVKSHSLEKETHAENPEAEVRTGCTTCLSRLISCSSSASRVRVWYSCSPAPGVRPLFASASSLYNWRCSSCFLKSSISWDTNKLRDIINIWHLLFVFLPGIFKISTVEKKAFRQPNIINIYAVFWHNVVCFVS